MAGKSDGARAAAPGALRDAVRGSVLVPGDEEYEQECAGFQTGDVHRPDVVVAARTPQDVQAAVDHARQHGLPLAVQATGHGLGAPVRGGVLVSTRHMTDVRIDPTARTAWIQAGVRAGDLVAQAARHGLAPVNGSAPGVGVVSYTLGGGVGLLGREFGYAADHVRRIDIVTADARLRQVTAQSDPELFWGLRGGGGGLGVVTGLEIELVPVQRIFGGRLVFDGGLVAEEVLRVWQKWTESVPDELTSAVTLLPMPDVPGVPAPLRGRYLAQVHLAFSGSRDEGERLVEPLRDIGSLLVDEVREMPYEECASVFSEPDTPHSYRSANVLLGAEGLSDSALRSVLAAAGPSAEAMCVLSMRHLGGAFSRAPQVPNAVSYRGAGYLLYVLSPVSDPGEDVVRALHERVLAPVGDRALGRSANFLYGRQDRDTARAAYADEVAARLAHLKAEYDPQGLFRFNLWDTGAGRS
ncbi:FAD-binding oxidoreductase [Streptomyces sp. RK75]|uniref:FAD-binding oxidoreductase n=1 Tax=Streptomyces sp. RK75 TaxID=2824895 RepID=UPI001B396824|nr:FAD-binding oxidoreductase [Streptomyces sp. RK75]MBQ0864330.1 FAD-binding oxidoreductase [Streptomyces sp. RK75]